MASPHTPLRSISNSSKKRIPSSAFSRPSATPSHASKMSAIFHAAAIPLHNIPTPSRPWSSNTKRTRLPLSEARNIHFGTFYPETVRNQAAEREDTPPTPTPIPNLKQEEVTYPTLPHSPPTSSLPSNISVKSLQITPKPCKTSPSPSSKHKRSAISRRSSDSSSNKENRTPVRRSRLPRTPTRARKTPEPSTPSSSYTFATPYLRQRSSPPSPSPRRRSPRGTPPGQLCSPPKRRRVDGFTGPEDHKVVHGEEDRGAGGQELEMVQLSPDVECYRKGRGPRRDRCGSYWDKDVIRMGVLDTASESTTGDADVEDLIVKNKDGEDRAVLAEIIYSKEEVTPRVTDAGDAGIDNKRFEFMVGRKAKTHS